MTLGTYWYGQSEMIVVFTSMATEGEVAAVVRVGAGDRGIGTVKACKMQ